MRGDFVTIAIQGDFGKARPALVIQADPFVQAMMRDFGAKIVPGSIKPVHNPNP